MANEEQVALLKQGAEVWSNWRQENPDIRSDLIEANLSGTNLIGANRIWANPRGADLTKAVLSGAVLARANLNGANLTEANPPPRGKIPGSSKCVSRDLPAGADQIGLERQTRQLPWIPKIQMRQGDLCPGLDLVPGPSRPTAMAACSSIIAPITNRVADILRLELTKAIVACFTLLLLTFLLL